MLRHGKLLAIRYQSVYVTPNSSRSGVAASSASCLQRVSETVSSISPQAQNLVSKTCVSSFTRI